MNWKEMLRPGIVSWAVAMLIFARAMFSEGDEAVGWFIFGVAMMFYSVLCDIEYRLRGTVVILYREKEDGR